MSLEQEALVYYYDQNRSIYQLDNWPIHKLHYIPLMRDKEENVYIHTDSLIAYCHKWGDIKFSELTRNSFNLIFPNHVIISHSGTSRSFRKITKQQFEEIIGAKL